MSISIADLGFRQSERMTDTPDGGGQMTARVIAWNSENALFPDVTDQARAVGKFQIAKIFAAITSANTDPYLDAGVLVFDAPDDPAASVLLFSTGSPFDERAALQAELEKTVTRGPRYIGYVYGLHVAGQRALLIWQRVESPLPPVGIRLEIIGKAGTVEQISQFLWITRVLDDVRTLRDAQGEYLIRVVTCELAEPIAADYTGIEPSRADPNLSSATAILHETRYNAATVPLYGIQPLAEAAALDDYSIKVASLYTPLIPTSFTETALPDVTPGGDSALLVAGNGAAVSFSTNLHCIKPDGALYLGGPLMPGSLTITIAGTTLTDLNGVAYLATTPIGALDYGNGIVRWNAACPDFGSATKTIAFKPAGRPTRVADTAALAVTAENRGYTWVITLTPIPAPGTLRVAYRVNNQWYVLQDQGNGLLKGADSSYGSGNLASTGTVTLSAGALPDVDSLIIFSWGVPVNYRSLGGSSIDAPVVRFKTAHAGIAPGSVTVSWIDHTGATQTLTDDGHGLLTGSGGTGDIRYATGEGNVRPATLPPLNTEFTIGYDWGAPYEDTFAHPIREPNGHLALTLSHPNIRPNTVEVEWNLLIEDYDSISLQPIEMQLFRPVDPIKMVRDDGNGAIPITGGTPGTLNAAAGTLDFLPDVTVQIPMADYTVEQIGTSAESGGTAPVYRNTFVGYVYKPAGAFFPYDTSGYVKVRYRVVGGDTHAVETVTLAQLDIDLTKGFAETLVPGSVQFRIGNDRYVDTAGQLYRNPSPDTGAGILSGSLDPMGGVARISKWTPGGANTVELDSLVTDLAGQPLEEVVFRTPVAPLKSGSFQLRFTNLLGQAKSKTVDGTGKLEDVDCLIRVDYPLGVIRIRFGLWKNDADLTPAEKLEPWYSAEARVNFAGVLKIWKPKPVLASSLVYNAVAQVFMPPDSALLGINAARLPPDGQALIFDRGRMVLIHHTASLAQTNLSPTQTIAVGRSRLYRAEIIDNAGQRLEDAQFSVDRIAGTLTMSPTLDLTGHTGPYVIRHTVADLARIVETDINGTLQLNKRISHTFPAGSSRCSGVLPIGTLQARVTNLFAQATWTGVWSDTRIGDTPLAQYDAVAWPVIVSNLGAKPDRYLFQFTSSSAFRCIGEHQGILGIGDIFTDFAPVDRLTGQPIMTIAYQGWGTGWATGNCLRLEIIGANWPVDVIRAIQPSEPTGQQPDSFSLLLIGNVDA